MPEDGGAVLVVDDDRINRALLSRMLEHEGYRPRTAVNGREALTALGEEPFDAVLLDIVMPEVDGLEVLRTLKGDPRLWRIPVIVISGVEDTESIVSCLELGADDYVQKPFDPVLLRARLRACLARRQFHVLEVEYQKVVQEQAAELDELKRDVVGDQGASQAQWAPVAVLAVGLAGLDDFAAAAGPAAAIAVVSAFQAGVGALAARFDGAVSAWAAEALTVVFGVRVPGPDPTAAGLGMAAALHQEMAALQLGPDDGDRARLTWGAGLALGDAVVGTLRAGPARGVAAVGQVVNRAAGLRDLGRGEAVLLDEAAFVAIQGLDGADRLEADLCPEPGQMPPPVYQLRRPRPGGGAPPGPATIVAG